MNKIKKVIIGYTRYISTLAVESKLPEQASAELAAMQARIDTLEKLLLKCKDAVEYTAEFDKEDMQTYQEIIKALK